MPPENIWKPFIHPLPVINQSGAPKSITRDLIIHQHILAAIGISILALAIGSHEPKVSTLPTSIQSTLTPKPVLQPKPDFDKEVLQPLQAEQARQAEERAKAEAEAAQAAQITAEVAPVPVMAAPQTSGDVRSRIAAVGGQALVALLTRESGLNPYAVNASSGACGLFQRLPCSVTLGDVDGQIANGMAYISSRYHGSPAEANAFQLSHGWY